MGQVLHGSATTTATVRRAIQARQESVRAAAKRYGISPTTVQKWRSRQTSTDARMGPKEPRSSVLSLEDEAVIVAFRRHTLPPRAGRLDALADAADLVGGQVVEHDRVAALQGRDQGLLDIAAEAGSGHRPVEKGGGHQAVGAQAGRDGDGFPMPEGDGDAAPLAARRSPVTPHHLRVCCDLVEEHGPVRIEIELTLEPGQAGRLHVLSILLGRVAGVFYA